jgi:hypothetical protein
VRCVPPVLAGDDAGKLLPILTAWLTPYVSGLAGVCWAGMTDSRSVGSCCHSNDGEQPIDLGGPQLGAQVSKTRGSFGRRNRAWL